MQLYKLIFLVHTCEITCVLFEDTILF